MVDLARREDLEDRVASLCDKVAHRARADGLAGSVVILKLRRSDFRTITRRKTIGAPTQTAKVLLDNARALLAPELGGNSFRLIGIGLSNLTDSESEATTLFADEEARARRSETVADSLRERFGAQALVTARHLEPRRRR